MDPLTPPYYRSLPVTRPQRNTQTTCGYGYVESLAIDWDDSQNLGIRCTTWQVDANGKVDERGHSEENRFMDLSARFKCFSQGCTLREAFESTCQEFDLPCYKFPEGVRFTISSDRSSIFRTGTLAFRPLPAFTPALTSHRPITMRICIITRHFVSGGNQKTFHLATLLRMACIAARELGYREIWAELRTGTDKQALYVREGFQCVSPPNYQGMSFMWKSCWCQ